MIRAKKPPTRTLQLRAPVDTLRVLEEHWHAQAMFRTFHAYIVDQLNRIAESIREGKR